MTNRILLLIMLLSVSFTGCRNDDDHCEEPQQSSISGTWNLTNVSGGLAGIDDDYESGLITWAFNAETSLVTISNLNTNPVIFDGLPTGTYDYEIDTTNMPHTITIDFLSLEVAVLTDIQLILDEGMISDGFQLTFNR